MTPNQFLLDLLERDYVRKAEQLHRHLLSIWTRFNFFITVEGLIISSKFLARGDFYNENAYSSGICFLGLTTGVIWYCFSANDRYLVKLYRTHVEEAFEKFNLLINETYPKLSQLQSSNFNMSVQTNRYIKNDLLGWRWSRLGLTDYATIVPIIIVLFWTCYILKTPITSIIYWLIS